MNPVLFLLVGAFLGGQWPRRPVGMTAASRVLIPVGASGLSFGESSCEREAAAASPLPSTSRLTEI